MLSERDIPLAVQPLAKRRVLKMLPFLSQTDVIPGVEQRLETLLSVSLAQRESRSAAANDDVEDEKDEKARLLSFFGFPTRAYRDYVSTSKGAISAQKNIFMLTTSVKVKYSLDFAHPPKVSTANSANAPFVFTQKITNSMRRELFEGESTIFIKGYNVTAKTEEDILALREVLNEVIIGAKVCARLSDGFPTPVTPHFAYVADWFPGPAIKESSTERGTFIADWKTQAQYVVEEHGGMSLTESLSKGDYDTPMAVVGLIFMIAKTLEDFFQCYGGVHNDLHGENVRVRLVDTPGSQYRDKTWVYKRADAASPMYLLPPNVHTHHFVEIIDFGRSRAWVDPGDIREKGTLVSGNRTTHARRILLGPQAIFEEYGQVRKLPDISHDIRNVALNLFMGLNFSRLAESMKDLPDENDLMRDLVTCLAHMAGLDLILKHMNESADPLFEMRGAKKLRTLLTYNDKRNTSEDRLFVVACRFNGVMRTPSTDVELRAFIIDRYYQLFFSQDILELSRNEAHRFPSPTSTLDMPLFRRLMYDPKILNTDAPTSYSKFVAVGLSRPEALMLDPISNDFNENDRMSSHSTFITNYVKRFIFNKTLLADTTVNCAICTMCGHPAELAVLHTNGAVAAKVCNTMCAHFFSTRLTQGAAGPF